MAGQLSTDDGDIGFQIAPMVDVIFVLLLFFMANVGVQMIERQTDTNLPNVSDSDSAPAASEPIIINIAEDGQVTIGDEQVFVTQRSRRPLLRNWLQEKLATGPNSQVVVLNPDSRTRHSRIIEVMTACGAAGVKNITFQ